MQRVCEDGGTPVLTTIVEVIELARESVETKRKNANLSEQNANIKAKLV